MTRAEQLIAAVQQSGFPHLDSLIHLFVGGSELHGAKVGSAATSLRDRLQQLDTFGQCRIRKSR